MSGMICDSGDLFFSVDWSLGLKEQRLFLFKRAVVITATIVNRFRSELALQSLVKFLAVLGKV